MTMTAGKQSGEAFVRKTRGSLTVALNLPAILAVLTQTLPPLRGEGYRSTDGWSPA